MILRSNRPAQITTLSLFRVHFTVRIHFPTQMSPQSFRSHHSSQTGICETPKALRMGSSLFKDFDEQFGSAIGDHVGLRKMLPTVRRRPKVSQSAEIHSDRRWRPGESPVIRWRRCVPLVCSTAMSCKVHVGPKISSPLLYIAGHSGNRKNPMSSCPASAS